MRQFRDKYVSNIPGGNSFIDEYYSVAPIIVTNIKKREDSDIIFEQLFSELKNIVTLLYEDSNEEALALCKNVYLKLKLKHVGRYMVFDKQTINKCC